VSARRLPAAIEAAAARVRPRGRPPLICLGFHAIDGSGSILSMAPAAFRHLMQQMAASGLTGISVGQWLSGVPTAGDPVILTFDDGFRSVAAEGLPVMEPLGFRATVFAIRDGIGRRTDWRVGSGPLPALDLMDREELGALAEAGWEIGAHTCSHSYLPALGPAALADEIHGCRRQLEDELGRPVTTFAYPYGGWSPAVVAAVSEAGFRTGWTTRPGRPNMARPLLLPRFMLPPRATLKTVEAALGPLLAAVHGAAGVLERLRGRKPRYQAYGPGTDCSRFVSPSTRSAA
jgi:peptidoglycan/xylan/chitin deacetylase (PgdA/CDA1 family)